MEGSMLGSCQVRLLDSLIISVTRRNQLISWIFCMKIARNGSIREYRFGWV